MNQVVWDDEMPTAVTLRTAPPPPPRKAHLDPIEADPWFQMGAAPSVPPARFDSLAPRSKAHSKTQIRRRRMGWVLVSTCLLTGSGILAAAALGRTLHERDAIMATARVGAAIGLNLPAAHAR